MKENVNLVYHSVWATLTWRTYLKDNVNLVYHSVFGPFGRALQGQLSNSTCLDRIQVQKTLLKSFSNIHRWCLLLMHDKKALLKGVCLYCR